MRLCILNNENYMRWLEKLDERSFYRVLSVMGGSNWEKAEVANRIRKIKRGRVIVHIPHASLDVPDFFIQRLKVDQEYFNRMNIYESDYLIDRFRPVDLDCLIFPYSRMFCDVERYRDDHLESMAIWHRRGVVYERDADKKEFVEIDKGYKNMVLEKYYDDHHRRFEDLVWEKIKAYGECLIIDLHSFSDEYEHKTSTYKKYWYRNPDICIGFNDYGKMKDMLLRIQALCNLYGYTHCFNHPYEGSIVPLRYKDGENVKSIMLEINKRIYLNDELNDLDEEKSIKLNHFLNDFYKGL